MSGNRIYLHASFTYMLPLLVAWLNASVATALVLVLVSLLWRWALTLSGLLAPAAAPELVLETISASHFVEKVRWCMDRLGVEYQERPVAGTLGAFFLGRTVPRLKFATGAVRSSIGNSPEILRYLWGRYGATSGERGRFLAPTPQRLELERRIDRCGVDLQVWVYHHILHDRELTLHVWGRDDPTIPAWQRGLLVVLFPVLKRLIRRSFRLSDAHHAKAVEHVDALLGLVDARVRDGAPSITGGSEIDYVDISFAAISGLWLQPEAYGAGKADRVRIEVERQPERMRAEVRRWRECYPHATAFVEGLYARERRAGR